MGGNLYGELFQTAIPNFQNPRRQSTGVKHLNKTFTSRTLANITADDTSEHCSASESESRLASEPVKANES